MGRRSKEDFKQEHNATGRSNSGATIRRLDSMKKDKTHVAECRGLSESDISSDNLITKHRERVQRNNKKKGNVAVLQGI